MFISAQLNTKEHFSAIPKCHLQKKPMQLAVIWREIKPNSQNL